MSELVKEFAVFGYVRHRSLTRGVLVRLEMAIFVDNVMDASERRRLVCGVIGPMMRIYSTEGTSMVRKTVISFADRVEVFVSDPDVTQIVLDEEGARSSRHQCEGGCCIWRKKQAYL